MKNRIRILLVVISFQSALLFGQSTNESMHLYKHEIGIDVTRLIRQAYTISYDYYYTYYDPYSLNQIAINYRQHFGKESKFALRVGLGGMYSSSDNETPYGVNSDLKSSNTSAELHIGLQRNINLTNRWAIAPGIDFVSVFQRTYYLSDNPASPYSHYEYTTQTIKTGGGFVLHTLFRLHERISISTEMAVYVTNSKTDIDAEYDYPGSTDTHDTLRQIDAKFIPPMFISLNFHF